MVDIMKIGSIFKNPFKPIKDARDRVHDEVDRGRGRVRDKLPGGSALRNIDERLSDAARKLEAAKIPGGSRDVIEQLVGALRQKLKGRGRVLANPMKFKQRAIMRLLKEGLKLYDKLVQSNMTKQAALQQSIDFVAGKREPAPLSRDLRDFRDFKIN